MNIYEEYGGMTSPGTDQNIGTQFRSSSPSVGSLEADEYGRCNGLTVDFLGADPFTAVFELRSGYLLERNIENDIDDSLLPYNSFRPILPPKELIAIGQESVRLLEESCRPTDETILQRIRRDVCFSRKEGKNAKLELPVLRSDPDFDFGEMLRDVKAHQLAPLSDHHLPLEPTDREKDEGIEFPAIWLHVDQRFMTNLNQELLDMSRESVEVAATSLLSEWSESEQRDLVSSYIEYHGLMPELRFTPMVSPRLSPLELHVPDAEVCALPILSDPSSKCSFDLRTAEQTLFSLQEEPEFCSTMTLPYGSSPERYEDIDINQVIRDWSVPLDRDDGRRCLSRPAGDLKLEVPLVADDTDYQPLLPSLGECKNLGSDEPDLLGTKGNLITLENEELKFRESLGEAAIRLLRMAEQEKPHPTDATARVRVPIMDFKISEPGWKTHLGKPASLFQWVKTNSDVSWDAPIWPRKSQALEMKMIWTPMPAKSWSNVVSRVKNEVLDVDDKYIRDQLDLFEDVMTSADVVWKRDGLAIVRVDEYDDDDDELESLLNPLVVPRQVDPLNSILGQHIDTVPEDKPSQDRTGERRADIPAPLPDYAKTVPLEDLTVLVRKRKREMELEQQREEDRMASPDRRKGPREELSPELELPRRILIADERTATESLLANYMELNAPKLSRLSRSSLSTPASQHKVERARSILSQASLSQAQQQADSSLMPPPANPLLEAPLPDVIQPTVPMTIIVSRALRGMLHHIKASLPGTHFIERDYNDHNTSTWHPGSVCSSVVLSTLSYEADIIVSPATGLVLTTMLKVRQKVLPGSKTKPFLRNHVERVSARYERLIIVVSEGNSHSESVHQLAQSDAKALAEFQGFVTGLPGRVSAVYVGGGEDTAAKWAAAMVSRYAGEGAPLQNTLMQSESRWELFLRRAGMNVYGAQAVLASTRASAYMPAVHFDQVYGLPAFLTMTSEERIARFESILGGKRVLQSVSAFIDTNWEY